MRFRDAIDEAIASEYDPDYVPDDAELTGNATQWDCWNEGLDDAAVRAIVAASQRYDYADATMNPLELAMAYADALRIALPDLTAEQLNTTMWSIFLASIEPDDTTQQEQS